MKLNQILIGVFLVLLIPVGIKAFTHGENYLFESDRQQLFPGFTDENIAFVQLVHPKVGPDGKPIVGQDGKPQEETLVFQRQEDEWLISSAYGGQVKARASEIKSRILEPLGKIEATVSTIIAEDADEATLSGFGLDDAAALRLDCFDANRKSIASLLIGREAGGADLGSSATTGTYVRRPKQKVIVLSDESLKLETDPDKWANKELQSIDESEVLAVRVSNEYGEVAFKRAKKKDTPSKDGATKDGAEAKDGDWTVVKGPADMGPLRKDEVASLVSRAARINAQGFATDVIQGKVKKHGLTEPKIEVRITTKDGDHILRIGNRVEGKQESYALLTKLPSVPFTLPEWDVSFFGKNPKDYFDAKVEPPKKDAPKKDAGKKDAPKKVTASKPSGKKPNKKPGDK